MLKKTTEVESGGLSRRAMLSKSAKYAALVPVSTLIAANAASAHSAPFGGFATNGDCVSFVDDNGIKGDPAHCSAEHGV